IRQPEVLVALARQFDGRRSEPIHLACQPDGVLLRETGGLSHNRCHIGQDTALLPCVTFTMITTPYSSSQEVTLLCASGLSVACHCYGPPLQSPFALPAECGPRAAPTLSPNPRRPPRPPIPCCAASSSAPSVPPP